MGSLRAYWITTQRLSCATHLMEYNQMAIETQTAAVQYEVRRRCVVAAAATQRFAEDASVITAAQAVDIDAALLALQTALTAAGAGAVLPATSVVVSNGATVNVENSAGNLDSPATAVVAGGVLTGVNLAAAKTILTSGTKVNLGAAFTGSGAFLTPTIAAGVITGGVLSAS